MDSSKLLAKINFDILDSLAEGVYIVDKEFKIKFVNKAAEKFIGIPKENVLNRLCKNLCKSDNCAFGCPITEVLETGKSIFDLESTLQKDDGSLFPVKLNVSVINDKNNRPHGGIISFREITYPREDIDILDGSPNFKGIIGVSKATRDIYKSIQEISDSTANVLITGETGVGKEIVANAVHATSNRRNEKFVKVNCAVLPQHLLASELFGHVKGAFTDAKCDRIGRFEYADGGTIFLDEIGTLPVSMQSQLLRILQEGTFERVGDSITRKIDVRIISATNNILEEEIKERRFREDLFYRLNVIPIDIEPLRNRRMDILPLAQYFTRKFAQTYKKNINSISDDALEALMIYDWPGNIRELENSIEYAFIRSKRNDTICICCLPPKIRSNVDCKAKFNIQEIEKDDKVETLISLLRKNNWNKNKVAEILGVNKSTIYRRLKNFDINE